MTFWKAGTKTSRAAVLLAELGVRGVDLIVVAMVLLAVVLARRRWLSRQPGGSAERSGCMVGQNVQAAAADKRSEATFHDASAALHELAHVQGHLAAQDVLLTRIAEKIGLDPVPVIDTPPDETAVLNPEDQPEKQS